MAFDPSGLFVMTSDGGLTWVKHGLPRLTYHSCLGKGGVTECSNQSIVALSFINPTQGWALESNDESGAGGPFAISVMHTEDGGKTWTSAKSNLTKINGYPDLEPEQPDVRERQRSGSFGSGRGSSRPLTAATAGPR